MWTMVATLYNLLLLINIIKKTVLAHKEDKYPFTIVYYLEVSLDGFHQNTMTNYQWYEQFNNKVNFGTSIGFTSQHSVLFKWNAQSTQSASY